MVVGSLAVLFPHGVATALTVAVLLRWRGV
jgi:hypothetical protein